jgi:hypothetical protein
MGKETRSIHMSSGYITQTKKGILTCAATGVTLESIMLSEMTQPQKDQCHTIPFVEDWK